MCERNLELFWIVHVYSFSLDDTLALEHGTYKKHGFLLGCNLRLALSLVDGMTTVFLSGNWRYLKVNTVSQRGYDRNFSRYWDPYTYTLAHPWKWVLYRKLINISREDAVVSTRFFLYASWVWCHCWGASKFRTSI